MAVQKTRRSYEVIVSSITNIYCRYAVDFRELMRSYLLGFCFDFKFFDKEFDGAPLDENSEEDDEGRGGEEDVLEWIAVVNDVGQGESNGSSETSVGQNELLLCRNFVDPGPVDDGR